MSTGSAEGVNTRHHTAVDPSFSSTTRPLRVLHGPCNVGNQPWVLSRWERQLGARSDLVVNYNTWLGYPSDRCLSQHAKRSLRDISRRFLFGASAPLKFNVLHYYFGRSFLCWDDYSKPNWLWFKDLQLARALGRTVIMTLQGCDVRLSAESAARNSVTMCAIGQCQVAPTCRSSLDAQRRSLIDKVLPLVDRAFVLNPELAHYVPGATFLPYSNVDVESFEPHPAKNDGALTIVHAPSDPAIKGSAHIIEAVNRLKERHPIEFVLIKGMPHEEAMKLYAQADLVIDQVLAGWYGGFAVEVMAMAKPVAAYLRPEDLGAIPADMAAELPIIPISPGSIEQALEPLLRDRQALRELGLRSRRYVMRWHNPRYIAKAMLDCYRTKGRSFSLQPPKESP